VVIVDSSSDHPKHYPGPPSTRRAGLFRAREAVAPREELVREDGETLRSRTITNSDVTH
jgi:hypothetical protein